MEHVGEPLLTQREVAKALEERRRGQRGLQRRRREAERGALETCLKGPGEIGARCARRQKKAPKNEGKITSDKSMVDGRKVQRFDSVTPKRSAKRLLSRRT